MGLVMGDILRILMLRGLSKPTAHPSMSDEFATGLRSASNFLLLHRVLPVHVAQGMPA